MTWLMKILKIYLEQQFLVKHCMINHLLLLKVPNMIDINVDLLQWSINHRIQVAVLKMKNISNQRPLDLVCVAEVSDRTRELAEELHKPIIRIYKKIKVHSLCIDNI